MTGVDGVRKAGRTRRAHNEQTTNHSRDNKERRDEAKEKHQEAMVSLPAASGTLTAIHARGTDTRASCRALGTRRAADSRGLFGLCWHGQCRRGHAPFLSYLLP